MKSGNGLDLNPVENIRLILQDKLNKRTSATTADELAKRLETCGITFSRVYRRTWGREFRSGCMTESPRTIIRGNKREMTGRMLFIDNRYMNAESGQL